MREVPAAPGNVAGALSEGVDEGGRSDGAGGIDSLGTNELAGMGRGVVVAETFVSPDNVARGIADEAGPMRVVTGVAIRGVVGAGMIDGDVVRPGGADGARDGVVEESVAFPGSVTFAGLRVAGDGVCFFREARPN